jgi:hypothetical protein
LRAIVFKGDPSSVVELMLCCAGFDAEAEDELSVAAGDEVTVHVEIEGWVQVTRARDGQKGLVPASYLATS